MGSFLSKAEEKLVDHVLTNLKGIKDFWKISDTLRRKLRSLASLAYGIQIKVNKGELSGRKKRKRAVEDWLDDVQLVRKDFRKLKNKLQRQGFVRKFFTRGEAAKLNARLDELVEQSQYFGELLDDVYEARGEALLTTRLVGKSFAKNLKKIWKLLATDEVLSIGIYGMGGVGKTALAKHINNRVLEKTQECVCWITVPRVVSIKKLQEDIARVIGVDISNELDEDKRASMVHRALFSRKKFVLILDDVWEDICLEKVGYPLHVEGCRLILTTRSLEVCRQFNCQEIIEVKPLHGDEAWKLFRRTLGRETTLAPEVENVAKCVAQVCDGLPLGIVNISRSMRRVDSIHVWRNALAELRKSTMGRDEGQDGIFKVLKYSFDQLDQTHQVCFLYCSFYPQDEGICSNELVRKFILGGLTDKTRSRKQQIDQGHSLLEKLVNVCLLQVSECGRVKMHDLVRGMALKIARGKNMVLAGCQMNQIPNEQEWTKDSIDEIPDGICTTCPKKSTMVLQENPSKFIPEIRGQSVLDLSAKLFM